MRVTCPACAADYEVPDRLLAGAPRMLRCARCGADFVPPRPEPAAPPPAPEVAVAPPPVAAAPEPAPPQPEAAPPVRPVRPVPQPLAPRDEAPSRALAGAWAASIAAVVLGVLALLLFRATVMEAWPPSARLFAALGLS